MVRIAVVLAVFGVLAGACLASVDWHDNDGPGIRARVDAQLLFPFGEGSRGAGFLTRQSFEGGYSYVILNAMAGIDTGYQFLEYQADDMKGRFHHLDFSLSGLIGGGTGRGSMFFGWKGGGLGVRGGIGIGVLIDENFQAPLVNLHWRVELAYGPIRLIQADVYEDPSPLSLSGSVGFSGEPGHEDYGGWSEFWVENTLLVAGLPFGFTLGFRYQRFDKTSMWFVTFGVGMHL